MNRNNAAAGPPGPGAGRPAAAAVGAAAAAAAAAESRRSVTPEPSRKEKAGSLKPTSRTPKDEGVVNNLRYVLAVEVFGVIADKVPFDINKTIEQNWAPLIEIMSAQTNLSKYQPIAANGRKLRDIATSTASKWVEFADQNKLSKSGDDALPLFPLLETFFEMKASFDTQEEMAKQNRQSEKTANALQQAQMDEAERETLSAENSATPALSNSVAASVTQRGKDAADNDVVDLISSSDGAEKTDGKDQKQGEGSTGKPTFENVAEDAKALVNESRKRSIEMIDFMKDSREGQDAHRQQIADATAKKASAMATLATSMAETSKVRMQILQEKQRSENNTLSRHEKEANLDEKDAAIAEAAAKKMEGLDKSNPLYKLQQMIMSNAMKRMKERSNAARNNENTNARQGNQDAATDAASVAAAEPADDVVTIE